MSQWRFGISEVAQAVETVKWTVSRGLADDQMQPGFAKATVQVNTHKHAVAHGSLADQHWL